MWAYLLAVGMAKAIFKGVVERCWVALDDVVAELTHKANGLHRHLAVVLSLRVGKL